MVKTRYAECVPYVTKDGSEIRELMHPSAHAVLRQSLAEAVVEPGQRTQLHRHEASEELYHITRGRGMMTLGEARFEVCAGDTVLIPPSVPHCIEAAGELSLHVLCCCSPAYRHEDTFVLE